MLAFIFAYTFAYICFTPEQGICQVVIFNFMKGKRIFGARRQCKAVNNN